MECSRDLTAKEEKNTQGPLWHLSRKGSAWDFFWPEVCRKNPRKRMEQKGDKKRTVRKKNILCKIALLGTALLAPSYEQLRERVMREENFKRGREKQYKSPSSVQLYGTGCPHGSCVERERPG